MRRVKFIRRNGGLGRVKPTEDGISGLIGNAVAVGSTFALDTRYELRSREDAEALGITADYDDDNDLLLHYHISEFFRMAPGAILHIMGVADTVSMEDMCDKDNSHLKALLVGAGGAIRQAGVVLHPPTGYSPTISNGLDSDVIAAIAKANQLALEEEEYYRPVDILLEGRAYSGTASALQDLHTRTDSNVSIVLLADNDVSAAKAAYAAHAAIGTVLGCMAAAKVNENIGWPEKFNIQSEAEGVFIRPGLSSGELLSSYSETQQEAIDAKGYIIPETIIGTAGVFINDSYTCTALDDDFCYIENNRVIKKAIRQVYKALAPKVKRPTKVDKNTGRLPAEVVKYYQTTAKAAMEVMVRNEEVTAVDAYVDATQDLIATNELVVEVEVTPTGAARSIKVPIGFKNPFKNQ